MDCHRFLDRYSDYDDSLLTERELSEFRAHLAACASCARYDRVLRKGRMLARQLPPPEPDPALVPRLQARLARGRWNRPRTGLALPPMATAALAAVTILLAATSGLALLERTVGPEARGVTDAAAPATEWRSRTIAAVGVGSERGTFVLPPVSGRSPRAWAAQRVDPRLASSYSPLVTGPPAYRAASAFPRGPATSTRRTLD